MLPLDARLDTVGWQVGLADHSYLPWTGTRVVEVTVPYNGSLLTLTSCQHVGAPQRVRVTFRRRSSYCIAAFEVSLPKVCVGHNVVALPLAEIEGVMTIVEDAVLRPRSLRRAHTRRTLMRLDIVRDFRPIIDGARHIRCLASDPTYTRTGATLVKDHRGGGVSLYRGTMNARSLLYDKAAQVRSLRGLEHSLKAHALELAEGRVRYELRLAAPTIADLGLQSPAHLTEEALTDLVAHHFTLCQFEAIATNPGDLWQALRVSGLTPSTQAKVYFYLASAAHGVKDVFSRNTNSGVRKLIRQHGFTLDQSGDRPARRLDLPSGELLDVPSPPDSKGGSNLPPAPSAVMA